MRDRIGTVRLSMLSVALLTASCSVNMTGAAHHDFVLVGSTFAREKPITGKWSIVETGDATVYRLEPDASMKPVSLPLAEDNLLFFLNAGGRPLAGNKDFSFTLNRRESQSLN